MLQVQLYNVGITAEVRCECCRLQSQVTPPLLDPAFHLRFEYAACLLRMAVPPEPTGSGSSSGCSNACPRKRPVSASQAKQGRRQRRPCVRRAACSPIIKQTNGDGRACGMAGRHQAQSSRTAGPEPLKTARDDRKSRKHWRRTSTRPGCRRISTPQSAAGGRPPAEAWDFRGSQ